jgi:cholera toxin transcriptional activator
VYLGFYVGALSNLPEINELFSQLLIPGWALPLVILSAVLLIPVRIFLFSALLFHAPGTRQKFQKIWPLLLLLWALSPFLLLHHINYVLALACVTPLVYSPFA